MVPALPQTPYQSELGNTMLLAGTIKCQIATYPTDLLFSKSVTVFSKANDLVRGCMFLLISKILIDLIMVLVAQPM